MGSKIQCESDYVEFIEIDEGGSDSVVRKYCGDDEPAVYVSPKNTMKVHHVKSVNFPGTGWILYFMGVAEGN